MIHVTAHALQRACERIDGISTEDEARALLSGEVFEIAAQFAGQAHCFVRLQTNERVVVQDFAVITVLPAENYKRKVLRFQRGRFE